MKQIVKHYNGFLTDIASAVNKTLEANENYEIASFQIMESNARYQSLFVFNVKEKEDLHLEEATIDDYLEEASNSSFELPVSSKEDELPVSEDLSSSKEDELSEELPVSEELSEEVQQIVDSTIEEEKTEVKRRRRRNAE